MIEHRDAVDLIRRDADLYVLRPVEDERADCACKPAPTRAAPPTPTPHDDAESARLLALAIAATKARRARPINPPIPDDDENP
jgi:hypothetical protein